MKLHGEEVKVGDKVWHVRYGWGEVSGLDDDEDTNYPILVHWADRDEWFTEGGKLCDADRDPTLFWQPIKRPKKPPQREKVWQWVCKTGNKYWLTHSYYSSKEEVLERLYDSEPIEPYLPSEIEREVKE